MYSTSRDMIGCELLFHFPLHFPKYVFGYSTVFMMESSFLFFFSSFNGDGVLICSIDNMPTQIPREATEYFGNLLLPYVPDFVSFNYCRS